MTMDYVLGVDVGTGGTRAVLVNRSGAIVSSATCEHVPFASPKIGWAEQDPHDWFQAAGSAIRQVVSHAGISASDISAVGLAGQMHGAVLLDENHRGWSDEMMSAAGLPMSCLPKLYESPEVCARISEAGAKHTGLKLGTPVVAGAGDQAGGAVGMGIVRAGAVSTTIGTSGVVFAATDSPAM